MHQLPAPVGAFIDAVNLFDLDRIAAAFTDDAVVNDRQRERAGRAAIREWAAHELVADRVTIAVVAVSRRGDSVAVRAEVDGAFDKRALPSPLVLDFYFAFDRERERLLQLVILPAQPGARVAANKQIVRRFFERFAAGDVAGAVALFRADATYWLPTTRETLAMPAFADALAWIQSRLAAPIRFELGELVAEANKVAVQLESFATTVEGRAFNNRYHIFFEFDGDQIARCREYNDTAHVFATLRAGQPHA